MKGTGASITSGLYAFAGRMRQREYKTSQAHVIAYREKPDGRKSVDFVHTVYGPRRTELARLEEIDAQEYIRLLERARWEICGGS